MECPRCGSSMQAETLDGHQGRPVSIDLCLACQSFWFDSRESLSLTPGRVTKFSYLRCPNDHGRLTTFFDFLAEKDFIRSLTPQQIAEDRSKEPVDPALPIELAQTRRQVETAFASEQDAEWFRNASSAGLVAAGLHVVAKWLKRNS